MASRNDTNGMPFWSYDDSMTSRPAVSDDTDIRKPRIVRSSSERNRSRRNHDPASVDIALTSSIRSKTRKVDGPDNNPTTTITASTPSPTTESPIHRRRAFSFKRNKDKDKQTDDQKALQALAPPKLDSKPGSPSTERKKTGFKKFFSFRGGKKSKDKSDSLSIDGTSKNASDPSSSATASPTAPAKADYFKSKKGKHLWVSRYGQEEIHLTAISMDDLILEEAHALRIYAIHTLSDLLPTPVMYDPFSPRAHAVDLMHRRSTFGEKFRNVFRSRSSTASSSYSSSTLRPPSANSDTSSSTIFGRPLEDVIIEDRMRTGDVHLRVPLIITSTVSYLKEHGIHSPGIFRVPGSTKRVRTMIEMYENGTNLSTPLAHPATPAGTDAQGESLQYTASDIASVLKHFLRELPQPIIISPLYQNFIDVTRIVNVEEKLLALRLLVMLLPSINRYILACVVDMLHTIAVVADESDGSKMNSHNLSVVMAPNLLRDSKPESRGTKSEPRKRASSRERLSGFLDDSLEASLISAEEEASEVIEMMIDYNEHLFTVPPELRDQSLLFHATQNPQIVTDVVKRLIENMTSFTRSHTAPSYISAAEGTNQSLPPMATPPPVVRAVPTLENVRKTSAISITTRQSSSSSLPPAMPSPLRFSASDAGEPQILTPQRLSHDETPSTMTAAVAAPITPRRSVSDSVPLPGHQPAVPTSPSAYTRDIYTPPNARLAQALQRRRISSNTFEFMTQHGLNLDEDGSGTLV